MIDYLRKYLLFIVLLYAGIQVKAQYSDSVFYYTGFTSSGTFNKTNDNSSYLVNNMLSLGMKKKSIILNSTNKWLYGEQDDELTNHDISSVWDVNLYKTFPHFYYWALLNYNSTYSLKVNNQLQTGVGIAYNIIDNKLFLLNISDGILYDYSDINLEDNTRKEYDMSRNSFRLKVRCNLKERLIFSATGFLQNSLRNENDYIIKTDLSLSVKLRKWLSVGSTYSFNKMTSTQTETSFLTYGVTIEHYF